MQLTRVCWLRDGHLLKHWRPSPVYPAPHVHISEPSVLLQVARWLQGLLKRHSSTSMTKHMPSHCNSEEELNLCSAPKQIQEYALEVSELAVVIMATSVFCTLRIHLRSFSWLKVHTNPSLYP